MSEEINFNDVEFGEPIEEKEPSYRDGYIRGIYRARNIIDNQQKEIEKLNNIIEEYKNANEYHQNIIHELETIQQFDHNKNNKDLDYSTIDEMTRRYMMVHDKILKIIDRS